MAFAVAGQLIGESGVDLTIGSVVQPISRLPGRAVPDIDEKLFGAGSARKTQAEDVVEGATELRQKGWK